MCTPRKGDSKSVFFNVHSGERLALLLFCLFVFPSLICVPRSYSNEDREHWHDLITRLLICQVCAPSWSYNAI